MKKALTTTPAQGAAQFFNLPVPPARKSTDYLEAYSSWVFPAVQAISQGVAGMDLKLFKKIVKRGEVETQEVAEHPALSLIAHANSFTTQGQLLEITQVYLELMGEAYWGLVRSGDKITDIWVLRPDWVKVIPDEKEFIKGYKYRPGGSLAEIDLDRNDVIPFKTANPTNPYRGYGAVQAAAMALDINDFTGQWQRAFFYNSAMPSIVFTTDQKIGEREAERFQKAWEIRFKGTKKAHQIGLLGSGLKPNVLTGSTKDMDLINLKENVRDEILSTFRVAKANIGIDKDVNRATQEATDARFIKQVLKPKMIALVTQINEFLLPMYTNSDNLFFDFEDPVPPDQEMNLKYYDSALEHGWLTINEVREREQMKPLEGGDTVYLPFNLQPLGSAIETIKGFFGKKKDEEQGVITLQGKRDDKGIRHNVQLPVKRLKDLHKEYEVRKIKQGIKGDLVKLLSEVVAEKAAPDNTKEMLWKNFIIKTEIWERRLFGMVQDLMREQQEETLAKVSGIKAIKQVEEYLIDFEDEETEKWRSVILPFLTAIIIERGQGVFDRLGIDMSLNPSSDAVLKYLESNAGEMIKGMNETTAKRLKKTLSEGVSAGEGVPGLSERVKDVFDVATHSRARTIARTEVLRATSFADLESFKESKVVEKVEWFTAMDERVRETHNAAHGQVRVLGELFNVGGDQMEAPRMGSFPEENINCRCILVPITVLEKDLKPIAELRKGHNKLKSLEKKEQEIQENIVGAQKLYDKLTEDLPKLKEGILDDVKSQAIEEKDALIKEAVEEKEALLKDLKELRKKAQEVVDGS